MLTPDDIAHRRFLISLRGYDRDEVTTFLEEVGDEVRGLRRRLAELEAQVRRDGEPTAVPDGDVRAALQVLGQETTRVLVAAEDSAREIQANAAVAAQEHRDEAAREARETVEQANRQAARVVAEAERRRDAVAAEIAALERDRDRFLDELRASMASIGGVVGGLSGTAGSPAAPQPARGDAAPASQDVSATDTETDPAGDGPASVVLAPDEGEPAAAPSDDSDPEPVVLEAEPEPVVDPTADEVPADEMPADEVPDEPGDVTTELPAASDTVGDAPPASDGVDAAPETPDEADVATVLSRRDATLHDLRDAMGRQCKRGMQEIQNEVLASIRDHGRDAALDDLLPSEGELDDLGGRATAPLGDAYARARIDGAAELGADIPDGQGDPGRVPAAAVRFREVLAHEITSALRATLRAGIEAEEPAPQLSERVGEAFRDLRGPVIETAVEEHLQRTYAHGLIDTWSELGVEAVRWQAVDEPRCPERRCRTNAAEGAMAIGDEFPSGDAVPPAHQGCLCVVVPST